MDSPVGIEIATDFFCDDCGREMFAEDIARAVAQTGAFKGICVRCVEQRAGEGEHITTWSPSCSRAQLAELCDAAGMDVRDELSAQDLLDQLAELNR